MSFQTEVPATESKWHRYAPRANEWCTPELLDQVERYAYWASFKEWGEVDNLLSRAMEACWRSLIYAAEQEEKGLHSFDGDAGVRPWVMASVRRALQYERDRRNQRKANCFDVTSGADDVGRDAVASPDSSEFETADRDAFWERLSGSVKASRLELLRRTVLDGITTADIARERGVTHQAISFQVCTAKAQLRETMVAFV